MQTIPANQVHIQDAFWSDRLEVNANKAIFHQWQMLEASGCIDNFRIAAGEKVGEREGWFFADSDATKWLDAAARVERNRHDERLTSLMDDFIGLLGRAQCPDGYLFTYNQIHFPGQRWVNLQIEHELYCHGHLIEAGVSHFEATGSERLLQIARKAADLLVRDFLSAGPEKTPGHEEIEIALLRLWQTTGDSRYHDLAVHFLEMRGRSHFFGWTLLHQFISNGQRQAQVKRAYDLESSHDSRLPAANRAVKPPFSVARFFLSALNGQYFQQHRPVEEQAVPVGHAVRFGYLETALAMEVNAHSGHPYWPAMQSAWEYMVTRRMDITGGLGALPDMEGFGRDYELNPETAYNETCAAIASLMWNWQLVQQTRQAKYSDLFEWQLYNAVLVGMGWQGDRYLYNNPTLVRGGITRQPWYDIPCCPSNLSRTFADLGHSIFTSDEHNLWVHQFIGCESPRLPGLGARFRLESGLPWQGQVRLTCLEAEGDAFTLWLRLPSWAGEVSLRLNGAAMQVQFPLADRLEPTLSGYDPCRAVFVPIQRAWQAGDELTLDLSMPIQVRRPHPRARALRGRAALTRGPLVYCLESPDNPGLDSFDCVLDSSSFRPQTNAGLFNGIEAICGQTTGGREVTLLPYVLWGNRGPSQMNVWFKIN